MKWLGCLENKCDTKRNVNEFCAILGPKMTFVTLWNVLNDSDTFIFSIDRLQKFHICKLILDSLTIHCLSGNILCTYSHLHGTYVRFIIIKFDWHIGRSCLLHSLTQTPAHNRAYHHQQHHRCRRHRPHSTHIPNDRTHGTFMPCTWLQCIGVYTLAVAHSTRLDGVRERFACNGKAQSAR